MIQSVWRIFVIAERLRPVQSIDGNNRRSAQKNLAGWFSAPRLRRPMLLDMAPSCLEEFNQAISVRARPPAASAMEQPRCPCPQVNPLLEGWRLVFACISSMRAAAMLISLHRTFCKLKLQPQLQWPQNTGFNCPTALTRSVMSAST